MFTYIFSSFFFPKSFQSDLGAAFDNDFTNLLIKATNINHRFSLPDHKGSTGQVENRNKLAENILRKYVNQFNQSDWSTYCWTAQYAYNKSISSVHGFEPDYLIFGMKPFTPVDFIFSTSPKLNNIKDEFKYKLTNIEKAWKIVSEAAQEQADKMQLSRTSYFNQHKIPIFKPKDLIILKRNNFDKDLNHKLLHKNIGPFEVVSSNENNITIQLTPLETIMVHQDDVDIYKGSHKPFPPNYFTPLLTEIIPIGIPSRNPPKNEKPIPDKFKKEYDIKSMVGKRISLYWPSSKKYYSGTIIGYNTKLTHNLIFYDIPTLDLIESCDYYKAFLFKPTPTSKLDKWSLLSS